MVSFATMVGLSLNRTHIVTTHHIENLLTFDTVHLPASIGFAMVTVDQLYPIENVPDPLPVSHLLFRVSQQISYLFT
jgi:hypothetical protein